MRAVVLGLLVLSACGLAGSRAADVQEITFSQGGRNYKGDGHASSVTFRRDGTAEDRSSIIEHDVSRPEKLERATITAQQFNRLAEITLANHSFSEDVYRRGTDSGQSVTVVFSNKQERHASFPYEDAEFRPIIAAINDLSKQLQWQDVPLSDASPTTR